MEYFLYQEKEGSDGPVDHQVNYSSSDHSDGPSPQKRWVSQPGSRGSPKRRQGGEPAAQRYKDLVEQNHRKNNRIWLRSSSVVRIPKALRKDDEVIKATDHVMRSLGSSSVIRKKKEKLSGDRPASKKAVSEGRQVDPSDDADPHDKKYMSGKKSVTNAAAELGSASESGGVAEIAQKNGSAGDESARLPYMGSIDQGGLGSLPLHSKPSEEASQTSGEKGEESQMEEPEADMGRGKARLGQERAAQETPSFTQQPGARQLKDLSSGTPNMVKDQRPGDSKRGGQAMKTTESPRPAQSGAAKERRRAQGESSRAQARPKDPANAAEARGPKANAKGTKPTTKATANPAAITGTENIPAGMVSADGTPKAIYSSLDAPGGAKGQAPPKRTGAEGDRVPPQVPSNELLAVDQSEDMLAARTVVRGLPSGSTSGKGGPAREAGMFDQARGSKQVTFSHSQLSSDRKVGKAAADFAQEQPAVKKTEAAPRKGPLPPLQQPRLPARGSESQLACNNVRPDLRSSYDDGSSNGTQTTYLVDNETHGGAEQLEGQARVGRRPGSKMKTKGQAMDSAKPLRALKSHNGNSSTPNINGTPSRHALPVVLLGAAGQSGGPTALDKAFGVEVRPPVQAGPTRTLNSKLYSASSITAGRASAMNDQVSGATGGVNDYQEFDYQQYNSQTIDVDKAERPYLTLDAGQTLGSHGHPSPHTERSRPVPAHPNGLGHAGPGDGRRGAPSERQRRGSGRAANQPLVGRHPPQSSGASRSGANLARSVAAGTEMTARRSRGFSSRLGLEQESDQVTSSGAKREGAADEARGAGNASMLIGGASLAGGELGISRAATSAQKPAASALSKPYRAAEPQRSMTEATLARVVGPSSTGQKIGEAEIRGQDAIEGAPMFQHQESQTSFQTEVGRGQNSLEQRPRPKPSSMTAIRGDQGQLKQGPREAYGGATAFQAVKSGSADSCKPSSTLKESKQTSQGKAAIAVPSDRGDRSKEGSKPQPMTRAPESEKRAQEGETVTSKQEAVAGGKVAPAASHSGSSGKAGEPGSQPSSRSKPIGNDLGGEGHLLGAAVPAQKGVSPAGSGHVLSQLARCSSNGNVDEADLVSSQEPTQNDYLADESGVEGQGAGLESQAHESEKRESVYVGLYVRRDSPSERSSGAREAKNGPDDQSHPREVADSASAEVAKALSVSETGSQPSAIPPEATRDEQEEIEPNSVPEAQTASASRQTVRSKGSRNEGMDICKMSIDLILEKVMEEVEKSAGHHFAAASSSAPQSQAAEIEARGEDGNAEKTQLQEASWAGIGIEQIKEMGSADEVSGRQSSPKAVPVVQGAKMQASGRMDDELGMPVAAESRKQPPLEAPVPPSSEPPAPESAEQKAQNAASENTRDPRAPHQGTIGAQVQGWRSGAGEQRPPDSPDDYSEPKPEQHGKVQMKVQHAFQSVIDSSQVSAPSLAGRTSLRPTASPIVTIEANLDRRFAGASQRAPWESLENPLDSANNETLVDTENADLEQEADLGRPEAASQQTDPRPRLPNLAAGSQGSARDPPQAHARVAETISVDDYSTNLVPDEHARFHMLAPAGHPSRRRDQANRTHVVGREHEHEEDSPRVGGAGEASRFVPASVGGVRPDSYNSLDDAQHKLMAGYMHRQQLGGGYAVPGRLSREGGAIMAHSGQGAQQDPHQGSKTMAARPGPQIVPDHKLRVQTKLQQLHAPTAAPIATGPEAPSAARYSRGLPTTMMSIESSQRPPLDISDPEFVRKYKLLRDSRDPGNLPGAGHGYRDRVIQVAEDFDLKEFMDRNRIPRAFVRGSGAYGQPLSLAIHDFHRQNREKGGWKNNGPRDLSSDGLRHSGYVLDLRTIGRDQMVGDALSANQQLLARSLESVGHGHARFTRAVPGGDTLSQVHSGHQSSRTRQIEFQRAVRNGLIDIAHAYALVQLIRRAHGEPALTDAQIEARLDQGSGSPPRGSGSPGSRRRRVLEFKWHAVMKFMHKNPQVLLQMLSMYDLGAEGGQDQNSSLASDGQFFNRRPRYTEKILQQIYHGLPGLIGHLHGSGASHAPYVQPPRAQQPGQRLRRAAKGKGKRPQKAGAPKSLGGGATGRVKQHSLEGPLRVQSRLEKNSFSPIVNRHVAHAREAAADRMKGGPVAKLRANVRGSGSRPSLNADRSNPAAGSHQMPSADTTSQSNHPYLASSQQPLKGQARGGVTRTRTAAEADDHDPYPQSDQIAHSLDDEVPHDRAMVPPRKHINQTMDLKSQEGGPRMKTGGAALRSEQPGAEGRQYASQFNVGNEGQEALTTFDDGTGQSHNCPQNHEMKMMLEGVDLKKPKTNERSRRKQPKTFMAPNQILNSRSVNAQQHDPFPRKSADPTIESKMISLDDRRGSLDKREQQDPPRGSLEFHPRHPLQGKPYNVDQRTELTSGGSLVFSRFEELAHQKRSLEMEEAELSRQRNTIVAEKDKVTRQLQRLDRKQELVVQEEGVKKQRLILEIEKKKLREDIAELDQLKEMLEHRKKDTTTGFSELAESNKELRSLKSGDLYRERSLMMSKQSGRSRILDSKGGSRPAIGPNTEENFSAKHLKPQAVVGLRHPAQREGDRSISLPAAERWDKEPSPARFDAARDPPGTAEPDVGAPFDTNQRARSRTHIERSAAGAHDYTDGPSKPPGKDQEAQRASSASRASPRDSQGSRRVSSQQRPRRPVHEAYSPAEQLAQQPGNPLAASLGSKRNAGLQTGQGRLSSGSPISASNMTFLSGAGVFDWAQSTLMDDVLCNRRKFGMTEEIHTNTSPSSKDVFKEDEVLGLIDQIKRSQKTLRDPEKLNTVFHKALDTLQELMACMNQTILFQMIAKKYTEANMDNSVKLLVRCKQLLQARQLAFTTLNGIVIFENKVAQIRKDVDSFLESSPREDLMKKITKQTMEDLPELVQEVMSNIVELRDHYKLFSKMGATTSKGNQVLNVMAYKRRDAMRYLLREYDAIKRLVQVVDVSMPPLVMK